MRLRRSMTCCRWVAAQEDRECAAACDRREGLWRGQHSFRDGTPQWYTKLACCNDHDATIILRPVPTPTRKTTSMSPASNGRSDNVSLVYDELRGLIVWGQLAPGARIAERVVAERLGLSRTPVRSALHRLQQEGFIASAGRGADQRLIVAPLTAEDGRELFLIVGHLEGLAARMTASLPKARRDQIVGRLRTLNRELAVESRKQIGINRIFDLDMRFHATYVEHVAGPRIAALH